MNSIKCSVADCNNVFQTEAPVSKTATFVCRDHTLKPETPNWAKGFWGNMVETNTEETDEFDQWAEKYLGYERMPEP